jgi:hypothetical protein
LRKSKSAFCIISVTCGEREAKRGEIVKRERLGESENESENESEKETERE